MMRSGTALIAAAMVVTSAYAQDDDEEKVIYGFPDDPWGYSEWAVGFVWGSYVPFRQFSGEFDCQSSFMIFSSKLMAGSYWFDIGYNYDNAWGVLVPALEGIGLIFDFYALIGQCKAEYKVAEITEWYLNPVYNLQTEDEEKEAEKGTEDVIPSKDIAWRDLDRSQKWRRGFWYFTLFSRILQAAQTSWSGYASGYYMYESGYSLGEFLSLSVMSSDYFFDLGLVEPMKPWVRYSDGTILDLNSGSSFEDLTQV